VLEGIADATAPRVLGRCETPRGEVVLRRRTHADGHQVDELIVNGTFAMDSTETTTERELGRIAGAAGPGARVLVGGLGLGYTVAEICRSDVGQVDVAEIEECLVAWARQGLTPTLAAVAADPRLRLHAADVVDLLAADPSQPGWDAIVLDVDNGPDFLIHDANARLYRPEVLATALDRLRPGGVLAIWCQGVAPALHDALVRVGQSPLEHTYEVHRGSRAMTYAIYEVRLANRSGDR
jgi:spermidine synthase